MNNIEPGLNKKSFSLFYNGGEIWCEHLDALYGEKHLVMNKFNEDLKVIMRPSVTSYISVNLDETDVDTEMLDYIIDKLVEIKPTIRKLVFVGLCSANKKYIHKKSVAFQMECIDDFEQAKAWLV